MPVWNGVCYVEDRKGENTVTHSPNENELLGGGGGVPGEDYGSCNVAYGHPIEGVEPVWKTSDGKYFNSVDMAIAHEGNIKKKAKVIRLFHNTRISFLVTAYSDLATVIIDNWEALKTIMEGGTE